MVIPLVCLCQDELRTAESKLAMVMLPVSSFPNEFRASDFEMVMATWPASAYRDAFHEKGLGRSFSGLQRVAFLAVDSSFWSSLSALVCSQKTFCSCHVPDAEARQ
jgi:hypothetical protein